MKKRLDVLLAERGLAPSREKAKALIMSGIVFVDGKRADKAGTSFPEESEIAVKGKSLPYVSRGGLKLEKALRVFPVSVEGLVCLDIGASTGGFTDCMLQNGARKVYAIDVGYGQLDWKLRSDERVVSMEKTNIRYVTPEDLPEAASFASIDVSFISLKIVLPAVFALLCDNSFAVCLIKPQFEAGKEQVGKRGVVRDPDVHIEVIGRVLAAANDSGFTVCGLNYSPVKGPEGNIEYLCLLRKKSGGNQEPSESGTAPGDAEIRNVVADAHKELDRS